ncbi:hypothetical protein NRV55_000289 [Staphylococcus pseudintermedius]|nr:hypothetical protein [Staphylococcus pseudintermedius]EGQ3422082.1 hypothetical protein [Staphylococcus pseudintermedius]EHT3690728.1 hypothetical protein [Staphylococcus pseudintermedius]EHT3692661.1 hypothetical protein [Staphylococcus pseudintermedius]EJA1931473.1 hypothetical protein [Staphylococcus pseudintermedius]
MNNEKFYVIEISKDDFGHEYEALFEVCCSEENAKEVVDRLNDDNLLQDNDDYYIVVNSKDYYIKQDFYNSN